MIEDELVSAHSDAFLATKRARGRRNTEAWRARHRGGLVCRTIRLTRGKLKRFKAVGYLDPAKVGNPRAEAEAVEAFIADHLP